MSTAIQKTDKPGTITLRTERAAEMRLVLEEEKEVRHLVREFIKEQMVVKVDYGPMPGVTAKAGDPVKNVLFKPGAEKLFDIFRCKPVYRILAKTVDPASGLYYFELRCRAVNRETGVVVNEGLGSASSYESRYRYRNADRVCPACKQPAIIKGNPEYGGGWVCFKKKGGCGAKWGDGAKEIEEQKVGKMQNPDLADVANTVLKIAKKRAQVDCAIGLARVSDLFTADLEDLPTIEVAHQAAPPAAKNDAPRAAPKATPARERELEVVRDPVDPAPEKAAAAALVETAAAVAPAPEQAAQTPQEANQIRMLWGRAHRGGIEWPAFLVLAGTALHADRELTSEDSRLWRGPEIELIRAAVDRALDIPF